MPMRSQPDGVRRTRRGDDRPPREYDIFVDGDLAGYVERLESSGRDHAWRAYREGEWPQKFGRHGAYLAAVQWLADVHRAAKAVSEQATAAEGAGVQVLTPVAADPFRLDPFADPLA